MISPFVIGLNSYQLTTHEISLLAEIKPLGIILFSRNIESTKQVQELIHSAKKASKNPNLLILIDEEGGKVSRTNHIFNNKIASAQEIGELYQKNKKAGSLLLSKSITQIITRLQVMGVNVCCAPVCDLFFPKADDVIGSRSYSQDPEIVATLTKKACKIFLDHDILPIIKHIPGHGRADSDSHLKLPVIKTEKAELLASDFYVFAKLKSMPMAMTAHVVYECLDKENAVTISKDAIKFIRKEIGYRKILISDDICMKALTGSISEKITKTIDAGCDIVLHCNGDLNELKEINAYLKKHPINFTLKYILRQKAPFLFL